MMDLKFGPEVSELESLEKEAGKGTRLYARLLLAMGLLIAGTFLTPFRSILEVLAGFAVFSLGVIGAIRVYLRHRTGSMVRQGLSALEWTRDERRTPKS